jgi:hypothetical protein
MAGSNTLWPHRVLQNVKQFSGERKACLQALHLDKAKEKGLQTSRLQALYDWCPGEDSNLHDVTR